LVFGNNTGSNLNLWLNSSNRTIDGGVNCATLRNDAGPLRLQSNGSDGIFIGSDTNVGIGTASPVSKLHVSGASSTNGCVLISGRDTYGHSLYVASVDTGKRLAFNHDGTVGNIFAYSYAGSAAQNLQLQGPGGNVGIGTDTPVDKLHVIGSIKTTRSVVDYAGVNHITFNNRIGLALGGAENGGNTGSDFKINTYNDSGGYINTMLTLGRATGNLSIYGAISKGSGSFDIKHPLKSNTNERLVHSFIEGPRCDLIYRGTVQLTNGTATVNLDTDCVESPDCAMSDGTFNALCKNAVKYLHNNDSFDRVRGSINGNILTIVCENKDSTDFIDWVVIAERKDEFIKLWERTNTHGSLITEYTRNA
jgi:hypothetical protein